MIVVMFIVCVVVLFVLSGDRARFYLPLPLAMHARSSTSNSGFAPLLRSFHISYVECVRVFFWHRSELHIGLRALLFLE